MKKYRKKFKQALERKGLSTYKIARLCDIDDPVAYYWLWGKTVPCIANLVKLKELLGVSGDEILEMFMEEATED